jgi:hypothetical protein
MTGFWKLGAFVAVLLIVIVARHASAGIIGEIGGTSSPGATLGPYELTAFPLDGQPMGNVSGVASPDGGMVGFSPLLDHAAVGISWYAWSNGYTGDVYYTTGNTLSVSLPADTGAVRFYAEPLNLGHYSITATAEDGTSATQDINNGAGNSASLFAFYGMGGSTITHIMLSTTDSSGFAVGEFAVSPAPEPSTLVLLGAGALGLIG